MSTDASASVDLEATRRSIRELLSEHDAEPLLRTLSAVERLAEANTRLRTQVDQLVADRRAFFGQGAYSRWQQDQATITDLQAQNTAMREVVEAAREWRAQTHVYFDQKAAHELTAALDRLDSAGAMSGQDSAATVTE